MCLPEQSARDAALAELARLDPATLDAISLMSQITDLAAFISQAQAQLSRLAGTLDASGGAAEAGHKSAAAFLRTRCGLAPGHAGAVVATARGLAGLEATAKAVDAGQVSFDQAQVIVQATSGLGRTPQPWRSGRYSITLVLSSRGGAGRPPGRAREDTVAEPSRGPAARRRRPDPVELPRTRRLTVPRLSDDLAGRIRRLIISEGIAEGARLPPERDLAERFGASRPTVSQALRALSLMGLVEIRRGSGAYVVRRPEAMVTASVDLMLDLDRRSLSDLMQLRLWLETLGAREAAVRSPELTGAEAGMIREALGRLGESAGHASEWIAADTVFHATIVRSAGNLYLAAIYESVHTAVLSFEYRRWVDTESVPDWLRDTSPQEQLALHEPIATAVLARDPEAAAGAVAAHHQAMLEHLRRA